MAQYKVSLDEMTKELVEEQAIILAHLLINKLLESPNNEIKLKRLTDSSLDDYAILFDTENVYPNCEVTLKLVKQGEVVNNESLPEYLGFVQDVFTKRVTLVRK